MPTSGMLTTRYILVIWYDISNQPKIRYFKDLFFNQQNLLDIFVINLVTGTKKKFIL